MIVNVHMDMVDRIGGYMFTAKFPFEYEDDHLLDVLRRGIAVLNGEDIEEEDNLTEKGWEMYRYLLRQANMFLIQDVPTNHADCAEEIVNGILDGYSDEYGRIVLPPDLKRISSNLRKYIGIYKRTNFGSKKHLEYTDKIANSYSQIMQYDFDNGDEILFDVEAAFVAEWEEIKAAQGNAIPTDLEKVKDLTKAYIRSFDIEPNDFGIIRHPIASMVSVPHPKNPRYGIPKPRDVVDTWLATNKEFLDLSNPVDRETWYAIIDEDIDASITLDNIYLNIIRGNWIDSWMEFVKGYLSFADRQKITAIFDEHMERVNHIG